MWLGKKWSNYERSINAQLEGLRLFLRVEHFSKYVLWTTSTRTVVLGKNAISFLFQVY
jgi:hypothetical protein